METVMIAGHFDSLAEVCEWANSLAGDELADYEGSIVRRVAHFQVISVQDGIDAALLVEIVPGEVRGE